MLLIIISVLSNEFMYVAEVQIIIASLIYVTYHVNNLESSIGEDDGVRRSGDGEYKREGTGDGRG